MGNPEVVRNAVSHQHMKRYGPQGEECPHPSATRLYVPRPVACAAKKMGSAPCLAYDNHAEADPVARPNTALKTQQRGRKLRLVPTRTRQFTHVALVDEIQLEKKNRCEIEYFAEAHLCKAVRDPPIARTTGFPWPPHAGYPYVCGRQAVRTPRSQASVTGLPTLRHGLPPLFLHHERNGKA